jgi:hypothetical protein
LRLGHRGTIVARCQHGTGSLLACGDTRKLGRAVRDLGQCRLVRGVDRGLGRGDELRQRTSIGRGDSGVDRGAGRTGGLDRLVDGRLDEGHHPNGGRRSELGLDDDLAGPDVPFGDDVGVRVEARAGEQRRQAEGCSESGWVSHGGSFV